MPHVDPRPWAVDAPELMPVAVASGMEGAEKGAQRPSPDRTARSDPGLATTPRTPARRATGSIDPVIPNSTLDSKEQHMTEPTGRYVIGRDGAFATLYDRQERRLVVENATEDYCRSVRARLEGRRAPSAARGECPVCALSYTLKADGTMRRHHGMTLSGFSTGEPCPGVGQKPHPTP